MDNLQYTKFNRALFMALLEDGKLLESNKYFNIYLNQIKNLKVDKKLKAERDKEFHTAVKTYVNGLIKKAEEYHDKTEYAKSIICYFIANNYNSKVFEDVLVLKIFIKCLIKTNQKDLTNDMIKHYIELTNNNPDEYKYIAEMYDIMGDNKNSTKYMEEYLNSKNPDEITSDEYNLQGCFYSKLYNDNYGYNSLELAKKYFKLAIDKEPSKKIYYTNMTIMSALENDMIECKYYWDKVLKFGELSDDEQFEYSAFCLKSGDFNGWYKFYPSRFIKKNNPISFPKIDIPYCYENTDLTNKTLLIYFEQGFGDTILMWGYNKRLLKKTKHIIWIVQDNIYPLLAHNYLNIKVFPAGSTNLANIHADYFLPSMDIPKFLNINNENASVGSGYIQPEEKNVNYFKNKYFNNNKLKIGISFSGNENGNKTRNIPIEEFLPLDKLENIELYSLNKNSNDEIFNIFKNNKVHNVAKYFNNFEDTAAILKNLDLVITCDNVILNLAGAIGIKTLALFNKTYEFRWYNLSDDNVSWYSSVIPFINTENNCWQESIDKVISYINHHTHK